MKTRFFVLIVCLVACTDIQKAKEPEDLFSVDKMAAIQTDMFLMDAVLQSNRKAFLNTHTAPDSMLFVKYQMDSTSYAQNLNYYSDHIHLYEEVLDAIEKNLKHLKAEADAAKAEQERNLKILPKDSIPQLQPRK